MIVILGYIHLDPFEVREFLDHLKALSAGTRTERGCLFYAIALDDAPSGRMLLAQRWQNEDALRAHLAGPNATAFQNKWANRTRVDVQRYVVNKESDR